MTGFDLRYARQDQLSGRLSGLDLERYFSLTDVDIAALNEGFRRDRRAGAAVQKNPNVPHVVRNQAWLCILDTIATTVAGSRTDDWKPSFDAELADHDNPEATVIGVGRKLSTAARVNAYMGIRAYGRHLEVNDLIGGHDSIGTFSALLALAETLGSTGAQLVESVIIGLKVTPPSFLT